MIIDMDDPNPAIKIYLEDESPSAAYVMLRPATSEVLKKIRERTHARRFKNVRGTIHEFYDVDEDKYDFELWRYCMPGWGNIKDKKDNEIEYSPDNAIFLLKESPYFANIIGEKMEEVTDAMAKRAVAVKKN